MEMQLFLASFIASLSIWPQPVESFAEFDAKWIVEEITPNRIDCVAKPKLVKVPSLSRITQSEPLVIQSPKFDNERSYNFFEKCKTVIDVAEKSEVYLFMHTFGGREESSKCHGHNLDLIHGENSAYHLCGRNWQGKLLKLNANPESTRLILHFSNTDESLKDGFAVFIFGKYANTSTTTASTTTTTSATTTLPDVELYKSGFILVATGSERSESTQRTEVVDLTYDHSTCSAGLGHFPTMVSGATGMLFENRYPLICGGYNGNWTRQCFTPGHDFPMAEMLTARQFAANILLNQTHALIAGGYNPGSVLATTEIISLNKPSVAGPDLPMAVMGHCFHKLNNSIGILVGGSNQKRLNDVLFFNIDTFQWTTGPQLKVGREWHSCSSFRDSSDNLYVVAAGGITAYSTTASVEILSLSDLTWTAGPDLPLPLNGFQMVQSPDGKGVVVMGGCVGESGNEMIQRSIFSLRCHEGTSSCQWSKMGQQLSVPRADFVAMPIRRGMVICDY